MCIFGVFVAWNSAPLLLPACLVAQSCWTLCDPMDCILARLLCPWDFSGMNTGVGFFLQSVFLTQGSNPCLLLILLCRRILYPLCHWNFPPLYGIIPHYLPTHVSSILQTKRETRQPTNKTKQHTHPKSCTTLCLQCCCFGHSWRKVFSVLFLPCLLIAQSAWLLSSEPPIPLAFLWKEAPDCFAQSSSSASPQLIS